MLHSSLSRALTAALVAIASVNAIPQATSDVAAPSSTSSASSSSPSSSSSSSSNSTGGPCNNSPTLCNRKYSDITFMGAHDSAFLRDQSTGNSIAGNQYKNATLALDAGLRLLQAQVHNQNDTLRLCHTTCGLLDAGPLEDWLSKINTWVAAHPRDVVTILLVNSDNDDASKFASAFQSSGLSRFAYQPPSPTQWPTLQSMIDDGKRVVSFVTNIDPSATDSYLLPEFNYIFETPFTVTELTGFNCTVDRPSDAGSASSAFSKGFLGLLNHFKDQQVITDVLVPDTATLGTVNSASTSTDGNLGTHIQQCNSEWQHRPSFVLVDFWDQGNTVEAADASNGVTQTTGRENTTSSSDSSSAETTSATRKLEQGALLAFFAAALLML